MSRSLGLVENLAKDSRRYSPVINNDDLKSGCCEAFLCRPNCDTLLCCSSVLSRNFLSPISRMELPTQQTTPNLGTQIVRRWGALELFQVLTAFLSIYLNGGYAANIIPVRTIQQTVPFA